METIFNDQTNPIDQNSEDGFDYKKILFILFNHKWKILISSTIGLIAGVCIFLIQKPIYISEAKLLVRYLTESLSIGEVDTRILEGRFMSTPLNNEIIIITSRDLIQEVAKSNLIDREKLLPDAEEPVSDFQASVAIYGGLEVSVEHSSNVIKVTHTHPNPEIPTRVLEVLIEKYFEKHIQTYRSDLISGSLEKEIFEVREVLKIAEESIAQLMEGMLSIEGEQEALNMIKQKLEEEIFFTEVNLAAQKLRVESLSNLQNLQNSESNSANSLKRNDLSVVEIENFKNLLSQLQLLRLQKAEISLVHKPESNKIRIIQQQIDIAESKKSEMIAKFPLLTAIEESSKKANISANSFDLQIEEARLSELEARFKSLKEEKTQLESKIKRIAQVAVDVAPHQRKREMALIRLQSLEAAKAKADGEEFISNQANKAGLPNIILVQKPTIALPVASKMTKMIALAVPFLGVACGIGLALVIEIFIDRSVRRPEEFEARLHIPLMLSIPYLKASEHESIQNLEANKLSKPATKSERSESAPWDLDHFIRPFSNAIRDRLSCCFRMNQITSKPELIALAGFANGSGTSTIARGLSASFVDNDNKVLYVNLNADDFSLETIIESNSDKLNGNQLILDNNLKLKEYQKNLFIASIASKSVAERNYQMTPKKLNDLIKQLKSENFDYIIFDMPLFGPTSSTLAMSSFMDKLIMIVEAGKTSRATVRQNYKELSSGKAEIFTILNKTNENLPSWLQDKN